jgi:uncharacterized membrane protein YfcA
MNLEPLTLAVVAVAMFLISFMKGAFGGGLAIMGIPLMALVMDPIAAGALLAPLFCVADVVALRYWRPSTWSKPDLLVMLPGQVLGVGAGFLVMQVTNRHLVAVFIAVITLWFALAWFKGGGRVVPRPRSPVKGVSAGFVSGAASMLAHSGGPPAAMYLLPLGLPKAEYAGTTFMFFVVGNLLKVWPWVALITPTAEFWWLSALSVPVIVLGVWSGWRLNTWLDHVQLYRACYALLIVVALKLLWDGLRGYGVL